MADIRFSCPECGAKLRINERRSGQTLPCPGCSKQIVIPRSNDARVDRPPSPQAAKATVDCPFCGEEILAKAIKCKHCGEFLDGRKQDVPPAPSHEDKTSGIPSCQQCGGSIKKTVVSSGNCSGIVVALIVFCVGIMIAFAIPVIGWVLGPIICIGALFMGGKRSKVWKCTECGSVVNRG